MAIRNIDKINSIGQRIIGERKLKNEILKNRRIYAENKVRSINEQIKDALETYYYCIRKGIGFWNLNDIKCGNVHFTSSGDDKIIRLECKFEAYYRPDSYHIEYNPYNEEFHGWKCSGAGCFSKWNVNDYNYEYERYLCILEDFVSKVEPFVKSILDYVESL